MKTKKEKKAAVKAVSVKKIPAKRGRPSKQDRVLLERTDKVVTKDKDTVLKVFGPSYKVSAILNEAMNEARAAETGLPVAKVIEVMKLRDHWCIRREWIEGETLADVMAKDKKNLVKYLKGSSARSSRRRPSAWATSPTSSTSRSPPRRCRARRATTCT